ncbi:hypothetical protein M378DRAFT_973904, partial [Amanita muscaria Koide BX008]
MDYDRKSTVSSFYGARKSSDVLNAEFPGSHARRLDDGSSFFNPDTRMSNDQNVRAP